MYDLMLNAEGKQFVDTHNPIPQHLGLNQVIFDCPFSNPELHLAMYDLNMATDISCEALVWAVLTDFLMNDEDATTDTCLDVYNRLKHLDLGPESLGTNVAKVSSQICAYLKTYFAPRLPLKYVDAQQRYEIELVGWTNVNTLVVRYLPVGPWAH